MDTHGHALTGVRVQKVQKVQKVQRVVVSPSAMIIKSALRASLPPDMVILSGSEESRYAAAVNHRPINTSRRRSTTVPADNASD